MLFGDFDFIFVVVVVFVVVSYFCLVSTTNKIAKFYFEPISCSHGVRISIVEKDFRRWSTSIVEGNTTDNIDWRTFMRRVEKYCSCQFLYR